MQPTLGFDGRVFAHSAKSGVERYSEQTLLELKKQLGDDNVQTFSPTSSNRYLQHVWTYTYLPLAAAQSRVSALYCPAMAAPFNLSKKIRLIVTIHDISYITNPDLYSKKFRLYYQAALPKIIDRADAITTVSNTEKANIEKVFPGVKGKIHTVYPGIQDVFVSSESVAKSDVILAVGSMNKHKNLASLLTAFAMILDRIPHTLALIAGDREIISSDEEAKKALRKIPDNRVRLLSNISDAELVRYYQSSSVFVFPSLKEGFGAVPLESMACACPVIASNRSAIPEVCADAAYFVNPLDIGELAEAICKLTSDQVLRNSLIQKGLKRAEKFTYAQTAAGIVSLIS